jgi:hypothetical protein
MPATIFDAQDAEATRREEEFQRVLEEMQALVTSPPRSQSPAADADEPARARRATALVNHQIEELGDLEGRYVLQQAAWDEQLAADVAPSYAPRALGFDLWWRASRAFVYRLAAVEALPEFTGRLFDFFETTRRGFAREVMRTLPGGRTAQGLLRGVGPHLQATSVLEALRTGIVDVWHATDPGPLRSLATLPVVAPGERTPDRLFGWSACEVARWLEARHRGRCRELAHVATVLAAGGWQAELGTDVWDWVENVRKAIEREEAWRLEHPEGSLFNR